MVGIVKAVISGPAKKEVPASAQAAAQPVCGEELVTTRPARRSGFRSAGRHLSCGLLGAREVPLDALL